MRLCLYETEAEALLALGGLLSQGPVYHILECVAVLPFRLPSTLQRMPASFPTAILGTSR